MRSDDRDKGKAEVDARIDTALRSYASPGEMAETRVAVARVLERARSDSGRGFGWWVWGTAAAAAALLIVTMGSLWMMRGPRAPEIAWMPKPPGVRQDVPQRLKPASPLADNGTAGVVPLQSHSRNPQPSMRNSSAKHEWVAGNLVARDRLPKLEVFPTPRPLTAEEQALVGFVRDGPAAVQHAVLEDQQHWDDPIIVAGLRDQPLQPENQQDQ
jgi:hypothetical protein